MNKMLSHLIMNYECEDFIEKMEQEHFNGSTGFKTNIKWRAVLIKGF
jgi:hypothetical protein